MVYDSRLRPDHGGKDASTSDAQAIECCGTADVKSAVCFERIEDGTPVRTYRLVDCLMSAVAMFGLKSPSLLQFDREVRLDGRVRVSNSPYSFILGLMSVFSCFGTGNRRFQMVCTACRRALERVPGIDMQVS